MAGLLGKILTGVGGLFFNKKKKSMTRFGEEALGFAKGTYGQNRGYQKEKEKAMFNFNLDKQMFDYQNAYNTPAQQMKRLKQAGLNPALMYGQGTTGNAQGMAQTQGMGQTSFNPAEIAQTTATGLQTSLMNDQRELLRMQAQNAKQDAFLKGIKGITEMGHYKLKKALNPYEINNLKSTALRNYQDIEESKSTIALQESNKALSDAKILLTQRQTEEAIQRAENISSNTKLNEEVLKEYAQGYSRNYAKILGEFFGMPDIKNATTMDKATTLLAMTPFLPGGKLAVGLSKKSAELMVKAYQWLKKTKIGFRK
jgi:hypothetical protein